MGKKALQEEVRAKLKELADTCDQMLGVAGEHIRLARTIIDSVEHTATQMKAAGIAFDVTQGPLADVRQRLHSLFK